MSGDIIFYTVEKMLERLADSKAISNKIIAITYCHRQLDAIEESKSGCQTYIDEYREQLKQYAL